MHTSYRRGDLRARSRAAGGPSDALRTHFSSDDRHSLDSTHTKSEADAVKEDDDGASAFGALTSPLEPIMENDNEDEMGDAERTRQDERGIRVAEGKHEEG